MWPAVSKRLDSTVLSAVAETWHRVWGDGKFVAHEDFWNYIFSEKIPISLTTPFFTLFVLSRASDNTASQNIRCMGRPPPQIFGGTVPPRLLPPLLKLSIMVTPKSPYWLPWRCQR